ncbi:hypothetical protein L596_014368 [Steinernema carpocapsae]|uniref:Uncharacterized protein n=1 Tax=Steinernema carpocapsae TaxID=34508 RepID=A0A4U5NBQ8_STECR|nr:hypothetical protein L596_014368 [Steinernema carpocapsae]
MPDKQVTSRNGNAFFYGDLCSPIPRRTEDSMSCFRHQVGRLLTFSFSNCTILSLAIPSLLRVTINPNGIKSLRSPLTLSTRKCPFRHTTRSDFIFPSAALGSPYLAFQLSFAPVLHF